MALQLLYKTFRLYLSVAVGFFTLFLSTSTFSANIIEIEQRFLQLENAELIGTMEEYRHSMHELQIWLAPGNNKQQNRYNALDCWMLQADTSELLQSAIKKANAYLSKAIAEEDKQAQSDLTLCRGSFYETASDDVSAKSDYNTALQIATEI